VPVHSYHVDPLLSSRPRDVRSRLTPQARRDIEQDERQSVQESAGRRARSCHRGTCLQDCPVETLGPSVQGANRSTAFYLYGYYLWNTLHAVRRIPDCLPGKARLDSWSWRTSLPRCRCWHDCRGWILNLGQQALHQMYEEGSSWHCSSRGSHASGYGWRCLDCRRSYLVCLD